MTPPTLPGSIPGLLRRGSPVVGVHNDLRGVVVALDKHGAYAGDTLSMRTSRAPLSALALDLSDATGRAHAVWYASLQRDLKRAQNECEVMSLEWEGILTTATSDLAMSPRSLNSLCRVVRHLAGLEQVHWMVGAASPCGDDREDRDVTRDSLQVTCLACVAARPALYTLCLSASEWAHGCGCCGGVPTRRCKDCGAVMAGDGCACSCRSAP